MLIIELNFAGYRFTREIPYLRRPSFRSGRFNRDGAHWRIPQLRHVRAA